ncbi:hypothetical protein [Pseudomonas matsuisoli]|uniref:hypothetical protein n=1 Tax=Pseudomonas matsuisoli TaxID=1515666 RepID=UPI001664E35D|nr:hypothetical protein [Pseudomonas matsuisoli]
MAALFSWFSDYPAGAVIALISLANLGVLLAAYRTVKRLELKRTRRNAQQTYPPAGAEAAFLHHHR